MTENKNIELNDEMMAKASGGVGDANTPAPKYKVGDQVLLAEYPQFGAYTISSITKYSPEDGWEYTITNNSSGLPEDCVESMLIPA